MRNTYLDSKDNSPLGKATLKVMNYKESAKF